MTPHRLGPPHRGDGAMPNFAFTEFYEVRSNGRYNGLPFSPSSPRPLFLSHSSAPTPPRLPLEQFAMSLDYMAPCAHGRLLRRSQKEDSGSRTPARHGQERGCSHLRGESFLGQTLRQSSSRRTLALSGEGTWQATEAL